METLLLIVSSLCLCLCLAFWLVPTFKNRKLPPGPPTFPLVGNLVFVTKSSYGLKAILRQLWAQYGPIVTVHFGPRRMIFVSDRHLAHEALVQKGSVFADRPVPGVATRFVTSNQHNINSAPYGDLWRLLRRNLTSGVFHSARVRSFARGRERALRAAVDLMRSESEAGRSVDVLGVFRYALCSSLLVMDFGTLVEDEKIVREIEEEHRRLLLGFARFNVFSIFPSITKLVYKERWRELVEIRRRQEEMLLPLIRARKEIVLKKLEGGGKGEDGFEFSYVDSLLDLELPNEEGRRLTEGEIVTLCSELLNAGIDTIAGTLQWVFANLVKHPEIQEKLFAEIESSTWREITGENDDSAEFIPEEKLQGMEYLKAVVMETLRLHPPNHFLLPHAVKENVKIAGCVLPKGTIVNFAVSEMGLDENVWENPTEFKPERFLEINKDVDLTATREITMMPFGAGRRSCPGLGVAMLHLQYFTANLVRGFKWTAKQGTSEIDLSEKQEVGVVMKHPLEAVLVRRRISNQS
ncbi:hypothetical protein H6P81_008171 [Aristolochia fimbriata]|uniref:Cytochrome P450 n=1 Tax=Aristolochia fimbriata TaxID=158543 RepID=A0AAV7F655_ARIFI|nr:hypothetical protein H6P81_008171 [Aristolochia fimbriata]